MRDRELLLAERSLQAADHLRMDWTAGSFDAAVVKYEEAQSHYRRASDLRGETLAELGAADVFFELSENRKALAAYKTALELARRADDSGLQIRALNAIAKVLIDLAGPGDFDLSLEYSTRAADLSRQTGDRAGLATSTNLVALRFYVRGEKLKARPVFGEALSIFEEIGDLRGQAQALANLGYTSQDLGEPGQAAKSFERSLSLATQIGDQRIRALDLTAIALVNSVLGEKQKALDLHNQALKILQTIGNRYGEAVVSNGIANVYSDIGANDRALHFYTQALRLFKAIGERDYVALTDILIGKIYLLLGSRGQALEWCRRGLAIARMLSKESFIAYTLDDIGRVYDSMGRASTALNYYNQALVKAQKVGDRKGQAYTLSDIGFVNERTGDTTLALKNYNSALALFQAVANGEGEIQALHSIARVKRDTGDLRGAYEATLTVVDRLEKQRARVAGQEFRTTYFASVHEQYQLYIDVLMRMHRENPASRYDVAALEASEKAHARGLLDMLREARADIREGIRAELLDRERLLQNTLNAKAAKYTAFLNRDPAQQEVAALKKELTDLSADYEAVEAQIRAESPGYAALTRPSVLSVAEIQKQILDPDTVLLDFSLGKERGYLWAVTTDAVQAYELPSRAKIEAAVKVVYGSVTNSEQPSRSARPHLPRNGHSPELDLSHMILAPADAVLKSKRIVVIADGPLQYVPFPALTDPTANNAPLALTHEIVSLPSVSVLAELRRDSTRRPAPSKTLAVFADPVFNSYDSRLNPDPLVRRGKGYAGATPGSGPSGRSEGSRGFAPKGHTTLRRGFVPGGQGNQNGPFQLHRLSFSEQEAKAIAGLVPAGDSRLFLDFEATKAAVLDPDMSRYRIIHFATHALLDNSQPELTGIVLSRVDRSGGPVDGFLRLNDIYNMKLGAGLVVLSACDTALGKPVEGEGLLGLTRGFMYAGVPRIVASLWEVDDMATAELMKRLYEGMLSRHLPAAEALREAQIAVRDQPRWRSPYYWAGFVLQGDWR